MKVELLKQIFDGYIGFKILSLTDCCKKIRDCPVIDVFVDDVDRPIVAIEETRHVYDWDDEYDLTYLYEIKRCPFCGKKIEVSVIKEEDVTDEYFSLKKKRNELWDKFNNIDSIKEREELYKEIRDLDNKINWYHTLCMYDVELK